MTNFDQIIGSRNMDRKGRPIDACSICKQKLEPYDMYLTFKAFNQGKCVLSAAQCFNCQMETQQYASEKSIENIMLYSGRSFNEYLNDAIQRKVYHLGDPACLITKEALNVTDSFELYCFNVPGANLGEEDFLFVGPTAIEQMGELLSEETRRSLDQFTDSLAPDSPEFVVSPMFMG